MGAFDYYYWKKGDRQFNNAQKPITLNVFFFLFFLLPPLLCFVHSCYFKMYKIANWMPSFCYAGILLEFLSFCGIVLLWLFDILYWICHSYSVTSISMLHHAIEVDYLIADLCDFLTIYLNKQILNSFFFYIRFIVFIGYNVVKPSLRRFTTKHITNPKQQRIPNFFVLHI